MHHHFCRTPFFRYIISVLHEDRRLDGGGTDARAELGRQKTEDRDALKFEIKYNIQVINYKKGLQEKKTSYFLKSVLD